MRLALYQPDIPQNAGSLIRLGACLGVAIDIIEPAGFLMTDRALKRAGMDYLALAEVTRHESWAAFRAAQRAGGGQAACLDGKRRAFLHGVRIYGRGHAAARPGECGGTF